MKFPLGRMETLRYDGQPSIRSPIDGRVFVMTDDRGIQRAETTERYEQRRAGERTVRFVSIAGETLKEITMDDYLELTNQ